MVLALEVVPLCLHLRVGLQFGIALRVLESQLVVCGDYIGKYQCHGTLALILGLHGHEQHLGGLRVVPLECLDEMPPAEGQHESPCLLERLGQRG